MVTVSLESLFFFEVELLFELLLQAVKTKTRDNNKNKTVFSYVQLLIKFIISFRMDNLFYYESQF